MKKDGRRNPRLQRLPSKSGYPSPTERVQDDGERKEAEGEKEKQILRPQIGSAEPRGANFALQDDNFFVAGSG